MSFPNHPATLVFCPCPSSSSIARSFNASSGAQKMPTKKLYRRAWVGHAHVSFSEFEKIANHWQQNECSRMAFPDLQKNAIFKLILLVRFGENLMRFVAKPCDLENGSQHQLYNLCQHIAALCLKHRPSVVFLSS